MGSAWVGWISWIGWCLAWGEAAQIAFTGRPDSSMGLSPMDQPPSSFTLATHVRSAMSECLGVLQPLFFVGWNNLLDWVANTQLPVVCFNQHGVYSRVFVRCERGS